MPLFDVHHGVVGPALRPQPLTSDASFAGAVVDASSETSECIVKMSGPDRSCAAAVTATSPVMITTESKPATRDLIEDLPLTLMRTEGVPGKTRFGFGVYRERGGAAEAAPPLMR